jgi:hypothetical protein
VRPLGRRRRYGAFGRARPEPGAVPPSPGARDAAGAPASGVAVAASVGTVVVGVVARDAAFRRCDAAGGVALACPLPVTRWAPLPPRAEPEGALARMGAEPCEDPARLAASGPVA